MRLLVLLAAAALLAGCTSSNNHVDTLSVSSTPTPDATPTASPSPSPSPAPSPQPSPAASPAPSPSPAPAPAGSPAKAAPRTKTIEADGAATIVAGAPDAPACPPDPAPCPGGSQQPDETATVLKVDEGNVSSAVLKATWKSDSPAPTSTDGTMIVQVQMGGKTIAQGKGTSGLAITIPAAALAKPGQLSVTLLADQAQAGVKETAHYVLTLTYNGS